MGITGELVRSVFSKSRSTRTHDTHVIKNNVVDKKKWKTSVRAYLCGDDLFNSVQAEEDSASVRSSEATVIQPAFEEDHCSTNQCEDIESQETITDECSQQDQSSASSRLLDEDAAATIIQSAFRVLMVRRLRGPSNDCLEGIESPSRASMATSIEVQTGNSIGVPSIQEVPSVYNTLQLKPKPPVVFRPKEDWDDSTVNSNVAKMRIQNRVEAMTRRERALAYAFSQQLRICSKKKPNKSDGTDDNLGWSWLERWMATRQPEASSVEDHISKQLNESATTIKSRPILINKFLDLSFEGKESCASNEVPVLANTSKIIEIEDIGKTARHRLKAPRNISRRKTVPTYHHYQKEHPKVTKREGSQDAEKDEKKKARQSGSQKETAPKDAPCLLLSSDHEPELSQCQNS